jgi:hypothetical protein
MRKLIEINHKNLITCDKPGCDFTIPYTPEGEANIRFYINKPCPKCGENLLTEEDLKLYKDLMERINWINKWFSWTTLFTPKPKNPDKVTLKFHKNIEIIENDHE